MSAAVLGLGTALPSNPIHTEKLIDHAQQFSCTSDRQRRVLAELYRRTSIRTRASVLTGDARQDASATIFALPDTGADLGPRTAARMTYYADAAAPLAMVASERALSDSEIEASAITHLVTVSCTGFHAPGFDLQLIQDLCLSPAVERTHIGFMGCHGAMNGMRVASALSKIANGATVLLCAAELCTLHFQYGWNSDSLVANSLFADGAAALVLRQPSSVRDPRRFNYVASGSFVVPDTAAEMLWRIGDHGFTMHLSARVPEIVEQWLADWLRNWLRKHDLEVADVRNWAVHPGGPRILDSVQRSLHLSDDAMLPSRSILADCGNMSSPTVVFIIERLLQRSAKGPCVVLGFGPGLTIEAALLAL